MKKNEVRKLIEIKENFERKITSRYIERDIKANDRNSMPYHKSESP